jgi:hypothetical protein
MDKLFNTDTSGFTDGNVYYLSGMGPPSGELADTAPVGSTWTDTETGFVYTRRRDNYDRLL